MGDMERTGAPRRGALRFRMPRRPALATAAPLLPAAGGRKKKKMAVARLGGGAPRSILGAARRLRVRWVAGAYRLAVRRLRAFYARVLQDLLDGAVVADTVRAQAGADWSFGTAFPPVVAVGGRY
ncbi:uncharacterized protein [Lolium perenne]|uniref:uncharacterized protein n=1 Tax=Lolium perenne TaxID=4522 RepID=UPI0021F6278C|nr:uncharacterized protein LOC127309250 [Lolium perenne]